MNRNIAIDGPAGAGKSTIAKNVAKKLGLVYIDTGAMYRAIGLFMNENKVDFEDLSAVKAALPLIDIDIEYLDGEQQLILNGKNVNNKIRTAEAGLVASKFAALSEVRTKLVDLQRGLAERTAVVMDGRDIGTEVLPDAQVKIFLTAAVSVRAKRRHDELLKKGEKVGLKEIEDDIEKRDYEDSHRKISPLKQAEDAILVDTSMMGIDEVVDKIIEIAHSKNPDFQVREDS